MPAEFASGMVTKTVLLFLVYSSVASYNSDPDNNNRYRDILKIRSLYQRNGDSWENPLQGHQRILKLRDIANRLSGRGSRRAVYDSHFYFDGPSQKQILRRVLVKLEKILRKNPRGYAKLSRKYSDDPVLQNLFIPGTQSKVSPGRKQNKIWRKNKPNKFQVNLNPSIEDDLHGEKTKEIATKGNSNKSKTKCKRKRSQYRQTDDLLRTTKKQLDGKLETIISSDGHFGAFRPVKPYSKANSDSLLSYAFQPDGLENRGPPAQGFQTDGFGSFVNPAMIDDSVEASDPRGLDEVWHSDPLPEDQLGAKEIIDDLNGQPLTDTWKPQKENGIRSSGSRVPEKQELIDSSEDYEDC